MAKLIVFNWKNKIYKTEEALKLARISDLKNSVICPPFFLFNQIKPIIKKSELGSQNVFLSEQICTGEITANTLKNLGVKYAIIGHSERRCFLKEDDKLINKKVLACFKGGLKSILCVGESKKMKESAIFNFIKNQLINNLKGINSDLASKFLIVAYEPVWAIGAGNYCKPKKVLEIIKFIKRTLSSKFHILNFRVLYGGSVDSQNIADFLKYKEIDGTLIGGASVNPQELKKIVQKYENFK
ncbi:MAG: triose-phosphate isomerase [Candidatus Liptonbacteria bacterium]|nr:triose-phosphate isomerase [Candidatus Liptonbacteria bacterium]